MEVGEHSIQHIFVDKEEAVGAGIERVGYFGLFGLSVDDPVDHGDDVLGELVEVEDGRVGV